MPYHLTTHTTQHLSEVCVIATDVTVWRNPQPHEDPLSDVVFDNMCMGQPGSHIVTIFTVMRLAVMQG
jgi:hypothetical protein